MRKKYLFIGYFSLFLFSLKCISHPIPHAESIPSHFSSAKYYSEFRRTRDIHQAWILKPSSENRGLIPISPEEIHRTLESNNYYWDIFEMTAKNEVERRILSINLQQFPQKLAQWLNRNMRGAITGEPIKETLEDVEGKILSVMLEGSFLWGFKTQNPVEEVSVPNDFDLVIILKDSDVYKKVGRELTPEDRKFLFGDNPRAPPLLSIIIIGDKRLTQAGVDYKNPHNQQTILATMSIRGSGITLGGTAWIMDSPPIWTWHASIKDMIGSAYLMGEKLQANKLAKEETEELFALRKRENLSEEEEYRLHELSQKFNNEMYWHFKLMKRILEAGLRIGYFEEKVWGNQVAPLDITLGEKTISEAVNRIVSVGVTDIEQELAIRGDLYMALKSLSEWIQAFEQRLRQLGLDYLPIP